MPRNTTVRDAGLLTPNVGCSRKTRRERQICAFAALFLCKSQLFLCKSNVANCVNEVMQCK